MSSITVLDILNEILSKGKTYKVGNKVRVIEPMDEYWRECVCLFLAAVVYYLKEHYTSEDKLCYSAVFDFTKKARQIDNLGQMDSAEYITELTLLFGDESGTSKSHKYFSEFLKKSERTVLTVVLAAYTKIQGMYFDKQRIAEFERVFAYEIE